MELLIRSRPHDARWTVAKSGTASLHRGSNIFLLQTDRHLRGTLDGSTRPYPSWDVVNWVFMPIHAGGDHWVTGAINLPHSTIYVLDSLQSDYRKSFLCRHISQWTLVLNSFDSVAGIVSRCSSPILRESMGSVGVTAEYEGSSDIILSFKELYPSSSSSSSIVCPLKIETRNWRTRRS
nr:hypothetical protein [Tanacetum cinerariifolium]